MSTRRAGVLLHPTSLPGPFGVGDFGPEAFRFVEFLARARQGLWQVLPLGHTGFGDSPYQCFSAFAGNPLLISPEVLEREGRLPAAALAAAPSFPETSVDYEAATRFRLPLLDRAHDSFERDAAAGDREAFEAFTRACAPWLDDYALFVALKDVHGGRPWSDWEAELRERRPEAMRRARRELATSVRAHQFRQYLFFSQWAALRARCRELGIAIMGDMPIFVAHDSADVWAHPDLFHLDAGGRPTVVAGVPPDYFSATGQLWGNPLYRWDRMRAGGYEWWIGRVRATLASVDIVRLDHFRGFEAYWEVPASETTAMRGRWVEGPGADLFDRLQRELGALPIVAENLGVITPEVEALRARFGFPGMAVLQFAFGTDPQGPSFRPHNHVPELAVYTGTHDNDTIVGWWTTSGAGDSTRSSEDVERERAFCRLYLGAEDEEIHWAFVRAALGSVARIAIVPAQDLLGLGSEARMNVPARAAGNWRWRLRPGQLTDELAERLARLTLAFERASTAGSDRRVNE